MEERTKDRKEVYEAWHEVPGVEPPGLPTLGQEIKCFRHRVPLPSHTGQGLLCSQVHCIPVPADVFLWVLEM